MERWLPIPGYEGIYEVSDLGRVKRLAGTKLCAKDRILRTWIARGYPHLTLNTEKRRHHFDIHRLVMLAFVGPCPEGHNVNHKDALKDNPRLTNLEYVTYSGNMQHAKAMGLMNPADFRGVKNPRAILTEEQVKKIILDLAAGANGAHLARALGVSRNIINKIGGGVTWTHLPRPARLAAE